MVRIAIITENGFVGGVGAVLVLLVLAATYSRPIGKNDSEQEKKCLIVIIQLVFR